MQASNPIRNSDILLQEAGEETLLYSPEGRAVHVLNPTARFVWDRCDGQHSVGDLAQALREQFSVAPVHDLEGDVRRTLETFAEKRLLLEQA